MNRSRLPSLLGLLALGACYAAGTAPAVDTCALLAAPAAYEGREVEVAGIVRKMGEGLYRLEGDCRPPASLRLDWVGGGERWPEAILDDSREQTMVVIGGGTVAGTVKRTADGREWMIEAVDYFPRRAAP